MKKKTAAKKAAVAKSKPDGLIPLIAEVRSLIQSARHIAASAVNTLQVLTNFRHPDLVGVFNGTFRASHRLSKEGTDCQIAPEYSVKSRLSWLLFGSLSLLCGQRGSGALAYKNPPLKGAPKAGDVFSCPSLSSHTRHLEKTCLTCHTPSQSGMSAFYREYLFLPRTVAKSTEKSGSPTVVERTLPKDANIHANEYQRYLPSKELLKAKLIEWARAEEARA